MSPSCRHLGPFSSRLFTIGFGFSMGSSANQEVRTTSYSTFRDPGNFSSKEAIFTDSGACYGDFHAPWKGSKQEHL